MPVSNQTTSAKSKAILQRLMTLHPKKIDLSLNRMHDLLEKLGNPQNKIPPVIHVAGTNGKGSTVATLRAIIETAGYSVHTYTSPHLVNFNERIRLAGTLIEEDHLSSLLQECETANGDNPITFFEITTAAAFLAFSRVKADITILEVGLGGRLDATNVINRVLASVITPIDLDHQDFLGNTLRKIAQEKAGIIKPNTLTIIGPQKAEAEKALQDKIRSVKAEAIQYNSAWYIDKNLDNTTMTYSDRMGVIGLNVPKLKGHHQVLNAGLAIATLRHQTLLEINDAAIKAGVNWVNWPARMQHITDTPLNKILPKDAQLWLDGGHNPAAAAVVKEAIESVATLNQPIYIVLGMMNSKDSEGFLKPLAELVQEVIAVEIPGEEGSATLAQLVKSAIEMEIQHSTAKTVPAALKYIAKNSDPKQPPLVIICGSLYLAGTVLDLAGLPPT